MAGGSGPVKGVLIKGLVMKAWLFS
jgi:hypothetical protein